MPPILNTYGARKKKRAGIPKCILQGGSNDVFDALKMENVKGTQALLDAKRKLKSSKKTSSAERTRPTWPSFHNGDSTFDRLFGDLSTSQCDAPPAVCCSPSNVSWNLASSFDFVQRDVIGRRAKVRNATKSKKIFEKCGKTRKKSKKLSNQDKSSFCGDSPKKSFSVNKSQNEEKDDCSVEKFEAPVLRERNLQHLNALSPILPLPLLSSTSTPHGKFKLLGFSLSPGPDPSLATHNSPLVDDVFLSNSANVSCELFSTCEEGPDMQVNEEIVSGDMFMSHELSNQTASDMVESEVEHLTRRTDFAVQAGSGKRESDHEACESVILCDSKSQIVSANLSPTNSVVSCLQDIKLSVCDSPGAQGECLKKCRVLLDRCDAPCSVSNLKCKDNLEFITVRSKLLKKENLLNECEVVLHRCEDLSESVEVCSFIDSSRASDKYDSLIVEEIEQCRRNCQIVLTQCDKIMSDSKDDTKEPEICATLSDLSVRNNHKSDLSYSAQGGPTAHEGIRQCQIVLNRCNAMNDLKDDERCEISAIMKDVSIVQTEHEMLDCHVVLSDCNGAVSRETREEEHSLFSESSVLKSANRNFSDRFSFSSVNMHSSPSVRRSSESLVLKPGKQWRRSLSILSKVRTSAGESSLVRRQSICDSSKVKGKLWESSVNSLLQLQSVTESIPEDLEPSCISLCSGGRASRSDVSILAEESAVVFEAPSRMSCDVSASQIYRLCEQDGPLPFLKCFPARMKKNCKKIGEGVYGEVFFFSGTAKCLPKVIKIIPIEGDMEVNGEPQKTFGEIFSEVVVAKALSHLRNGTMNASTSFNEVQGIRCVKGRYPHWLLELWHDFNDSKGSENDSPEIFLANQLYLVLELSNGGKDLESFVFSSADQGLSAFRQVALALAVAEEALCFEHRDLHWGNVLISDTKERQVSFILNGEAMSTASRGIQVSIIDFTLSRVSDPISGNPIFYDLSKDETLFTAEGDYQFEVYRMMKEYHSNKWDTFIPKTNVAWLHYLLDKLCTMARYKNRTSKVHNRAIDILSEMRDSILMFENVSSFVKCDLFQ